MSALTQSPQYLGTTSAYPAPVREEQNPFKSPEIGKLAEALAKAQSEIKNASKDKDNPFYKSTYADLASVWDACREPLSKNSLSVTQTMGMDPSGRITLITLLMHSSGQWISSVLPVIPVKQDPQGIGSAITYMRRFALGALVGVAPAEKATQDDVDDDDDGNAASGNESDRQSHYRSLMAMYQPFLKKFPDQKLDQVLKSRYNVMEVKGLDLGQLKDFERYISTELKSSPVQAQISQTKIVHGEKKTERKPSEAQLKRLFAISKQFGVSDAEVKTYIFNRYKHESRNDLSLSEYNELCDGITAKTISFSQYQGAVKSTQESSLRSNVVSEEDLPWNEDTKLLI